MLRIRPQSGAAVKARRTNRRCGFGFLMLGMEGLIPQHGMDACGYTCSALVKTFLL